MVEKKNKKGSLIASTAITLIIVALLIFSGPIAQAVLVTLSADKTSVQIGDAAQNQITFTAWVNLSNPDAYVPIQRVFLNLSGNSPRYFSWEPLNGLDIRGTAFPGEISVTPSGDSFGSGNFGTGYGYDSNNANYYNFGYGYGYGNGTVSLNRSFTVILNTSMMFDGSYTGATNVYAAGSSLAHGFTSSSLSFTLLPRMVNITVSPIPANTTQSSGLITTPVGTFEYVVTTNGTTVPVALNVTISVEPPTGSTDITSFTSAAIPDIYFNISENNTNWFANISNIQFRGYYNASNIPSNVAESTLRPFRFATTWQRLDCASLGGCNATLNDGAILYASGVNTTGDYVWANLSRLSTFGIAGTVSAAPSRGSSGGSTGGGGVTTSEPFDNIAKSETHDKDLISNAPVTYTFTTPEIGIYEVVVTDTNNENGISLRAEYLNGISKLVTANPPGTVYKNVNLWIGTQRLNSVLLRFKLDNTWLTNNNVAAGDVKMLKWDGSQWTQLDTALTTADSASTYYEAKSSTLSIFAISSTKGVAVPSGTAAGATTPTAATPGATTPGASPTATATKAPGFEMVISLAALSVLIAISLRNRKRR